MGDDNKQMLAICGSSANDEQHSNQPRQPRNLEGLLRYSLQAAAGSPNPNVPEQEQIGSRSLHEQDRQFLENLVSSLSVDVTKVLKTSISTLQAEYTPGCYPKNVVDAFDAILDLVDNMDMANDCYKLGGFDVCIRWLEIGPPELRWRAASVIAECCQNNPFCQSMAVQAGLLVTLINLAQNDPDEKVQIKSFHAISCIVRNNQSAFLNFLSLNGHKFIQHCLASCNLKLKTKAAFFISVTADIEPMFKEQLWDIGVTKILSTMCCHAQETFILTDIDCFEQCLSAFMCLIKDSKKKIEDKDNIIEQLEVYPKLVGRDPSYSECLHLIASIIEVISSK